MALTDECCEGTHEACDYSLCTCSCHSRYDFDDEGDCFDYDEEWPCEEDPHEVG